MEGVTRVELGGHEVLRGLTTGTGGCSYVHLSPRSVRRELLGPGGSVLETVLLAPRGAGAVVQWVPGRAGELMLSGSFVCPGRATGHQGDGPVLVLERAGLPDALFSVTPRPDTWRVAPEPGRDDTRISFTSRAPEGVVTLLIGHRSPRSTASPLVLLGRVRAHERRAEAELRAVRETRLATDTGVSGLDDALAWAVARLPGAVDAAGRVRAGVGSDCPEPGEGRDETEGLSRLWILLGALAAGDRDTARRLVTGAPGGVPDLLGLGWWVRWTGDPEPLVRHAHVVDDILTRERAPEAGPTSGVGGVLRAAAIPAVAEGMEAAGHAEKASAWRGLLPRSLPMVGSPAPTGGGDGLGADLLRALFLHRPLRIEPGSPPGPGAPVERALRAWAGFVGTDPDGAYVELRAHLATGLGDVPGSWPAAPGHPCFHWAPAAALTPGILLFGLLGARAEAAWGRLRLAPTLPPSWRAFRVSGIAAADARVSLGYERHGSTHRFQLDQRTGRVPLNLVFEPRLPMTGVKEVRVDGEPAEVEITDGPAGRTVLALQLPLDRQRVVTVEEG